MSENDFFTITSLLTFAGSTGATTVVTKALRHAFPSLDKPWLGLVIAEAICLVTALISIPADAGTMDFVRIVFVAIVNGFLVFSTSEGLATAFRAFGARQETAPSSMS